MPTKFNSIQPDGSRRKCGRGVTIKDIAADLGLSFQAVSQALNPRKNTSHVSEATRARVLAAAERMGYRVHRAARMMRSRHSGLLGVLIFEHPHQVMHHRLHHVLTGVRKAGYRPFVHLADTRGPEGAMDGCLTMLDARVEGVVLVDPIGFPEEAPVLNLLEHNIPVVSLGSHQWAAIASYQADRRQGFLELTRHLVECGCRSLVLLRAASSPRMRKFFGRFQEDMTRGFKQGVAAAAAGAGQVRGRINCVEVAMDWEQTEGVAIHPIFRSGYAGMREILRLGEMPDGVLCQADCWVHGALRACFEAGVRVPDDLLLAGFNDEPSSSAGVPPVTTVVQPYAELAARVVADLAAQIRGEQPNRPGAVTTLPGRLVVRASTATASMPGALSDLREMALR